MFYAYRINDDGSVWIIKKEKKTDLPKWCESDDTVTITEELPQEVINTQEAIKSSNNMQNKVDNISTYIYTHYSEQKQGQDRGYQAYSQTVIVGTTAQQGSPVTLDELTIEVMGAVLQIWDKTINLSDYLTVKPIELQEHYAKLVKIGSRLKWTKMCIDEGKLAMVESREPSYPPYPNFGGA